MNKVQELQFELMKEATFNNFDGEKVVESLKEHKDLWKGVIMDRAGYTGMNPKPIEPCIDLIKLRDIGGGYWNVDTLFILPSGKDDEKLKLLAESWDADEVDWLEGKEVSHAFGQAGPNAQKKLLRVWWD